MARRPSSTMKDELGNVYSRLTVIKKIDVIRGQTRWECVCECGNVRIVRGDSLRSGKIVSCGCLGAERRKASVTKHGHTSSNKRSSEYNCWLHMTDRCYNEKNLQYEDYGGRGISICDEWRTDFVAFLNYVGPRPSPNLSIDRIDNDGNYEPGNVKWSTQSEQNKNTRKSRYLTYKGQKMHISDIIKISPVSYKTIFWRIDHGWSIDSSIETPPLNRKNVR